MPRSARAIVWQDRRTADFCRERLADEPWIFARTGLVLDPYFSATKIRWLLDADPGDPRRAPRPASSPSGPSTRFLVWRLTGGRVHATDRTNASRTLLVNLHSAAVGRRPVPLLRRPRALLPEIRPSVADFGVTAGLDFLPDGIPIRGVAGDQQAALFGQGAFSAGEAKCTYGTGAFFLQHIGDVPTLSRHRLLTTIAASGPGPPQYALEGARVHRRRGRAVAPRRAQLFADAPAIEALAESSDPPSRSSSCPASSAWAHRTGFPRRAASCSA